MLKASFGRFGWELSKMPVLELATTGRKSGQKRSVMLTSPLQEGAPKKPMRARVANAEERARMWPKVTGDHKNYADYQTKTTREIPLVIIEPT